MPAGPGAGGAGSVVGPGAAPAAAADPTAVGSAPASPRRPGPTLGDDHFDKMAAFREHEDQFIPEAELAIRRQQFMFSNLKEDDFPSQPWSIIGSPKGCWVGTHPPELFQAYKEGKIKEKYSGALMLVDLDLLQR